MGGARSEGVAAAAAVWYGRVRSGAQTAGRRVAAVPAAFVLVPLVLAQWVVTIVVGRNATHNGWLYYHGGDGTYYWTTTWSLAHHHVPETIISYGLPVFLWPLGLIYGANMLAGLPAVVVLQVLVLAPAGVLALYGIAARVGGRLFGYAATAVWVLAPPIVLGILRSFGEPPFDSKVHNLVIPNALGLTNLADYASMILAIVATYLVLRALDERRWDDVVLAGLCGGMLLAVKPANAYWLAVPLVAFLAAKRWREGLVFAGLLLPALVTLTIWKKIGLGYIPAAAPPPTRTLALGSSAVPVSIQQYQLFDWHTLRENYWWLSDASRGFEALLLLWIVGMVGLIRRVPIPGVMITTWCLVYLLFKGAARGRASVETTSAFRLVVPSYPAFVLLLVAGAFVVVSAALKLRWEPRRVVAAVAPSPPTRVAVVAAVVLAVYPFLFVVTTSAWSTDRVAKDPFANTLFPVSNELRVKAAVEQDGVHLTWQPPHHGRTRIYYIVFRAQSGQDCELRTSGARDCLLTGATASYTSRPEHVDRRVQDGVSYRVGMMAGWAGDLANSDLLMVGPPVVVHVPQR